MKKWEIERGQNTHRIEADFVDVNEAGFVMFYKNTEAVLVSGSVPVFAQTYSYCKELIACFSGVISVKQIGEDNEQKESTKA